MECLDTVQKKKPTIVTVSIHRFSSRQILALMKISELTNSIDGTSNVSFLVGLLQKFDLAITWDNEHLIFPPLLPVRLNLDTMVRC